MPVRVFFHLLLTSSVPGHFMPALFGLLEASGNDLVDVKVMVIFEEKNCDHNIVSPLVPV